MEQRAAHLFRRGTIDVRSAAFPLAHRLLRSWVEVVMKNPAHAHSNIRPLQLVAPHAVAEQDGRVYEYLCVDGRIHGTLRISSSTHEPLAELAVEHGVIHGLARVFGRHPTGNRVVHFHRGQLHGDFVHLDNEGNIQQAGGFTAGIPTGEWLVLDDDGETLFEDDFDSVEDLGRALAYERMLTEVALHDEILRAMHRFDLFSVDGAPDQLLAA
jgi:hypothetical protein